ncbi:MAG: glycosyltransferase family 4 protein [Nitrososphaerota archaeon]
MGVYITIYDFSSIGQFKALKIIKCIEDFVKADIIIFNSPPTGVLFPFLFLAWFLRKKNIFICHGGIFLERKDRLSRIEQSILLFLMKNDIINYSIFPSRWLRNLAVAYCGKKTIKSLIIPNGVDVEEIDSYSSIDLPTENNILFVGRLAKIKGISVLLDAFLQLIAEKSNYNLYLLGPLGDLDRDETEKLRKTPHCHYLGKMSHSNTLRFMKSVDLIVVPSFFENFPLVVLEAMACAKPIIATSVGGIPEIIKNGINGILIPPSDAKKLANAIKELLNDEHKRLLLSKNAYYSVKEKYDWKKIALLYKKTFIEICK